MSNELSASTCRDGLADILLIEDNPTDVLMTCEALDYHSVPNALHVAEDGVAAMEFLRQEGVYHSARVPGLIILDLNLPRKSGLEVLGEIKTDPALVMIPVVILTTSTADDDIAASYYLHANCFISKPVDFARFLEVVRLITDFWLGAVTLPRGQQ